MKKLFVSVLKYANGECTNHGVTGNRDSMWLFTGCTEQEAIGYCNEHGIPLEECLIYEDRHLWGEHRPIAIPLVKPQNTVGPMFGGNYICASGSDPDFPKYEGLKYINVPIPVHDRFETEREYEMYSK